MYCILYVLFVTNLIKSKSPSATEKRYMKAVMKSYLLIHRKCLPVRRCFRPSFKSAEKMNFPQVVGQFTSRGQLLSAQYSQARMTTMCWCSIHALPSGSYLHCSEHTRTSSRDPVKSLPQQSFEFLMLEEVFSCTHISRQMLRCDEEAENCAAASLCSCL